MNLKMNLDKKSLIQIGVLVVLVAVGAGVYLMQQRDGLGFITGFFESKPVTPRAPTAKTPALAGDKKSAAAPAETAPTPSVPAEKKAAAATIPATPAKGQIHGKPFVVESSVIENGVLMLRLGKDVTADLEVRIKLFTSPWEAPAGKSFKVAGAAGADAPQIVLAWKEEGQGALSEQKFTDKYTLLLEFGQEKDKKLPGKISLSLPDEVKSNVAGTFEANIRGFRLIDGKPDLGADSVDTLQYLAFRELLEKDPNNTEIVASRDGRYSPPGSPGKNMTGYLEVVYRTGQGPSLVQRFQFEKDTGAWKVARTLNADQLDEAHPLQTPGAKESPEKVLIHLAAKRLEADIRKKFPKKGIYEPGLAARYNDKFKIGVCEASYKLDPSGDTLETAYLFRRRASGWSLERELGKKEKVNFDTGRIEKR